VTWGNGTTGTSGVISITNSLIGSTTGDMGDSCNVTVLSNGNYVVNNPGWDNGTVKNVGAVTWGNGTTGITGAVSITNSLVGSTAGDQVGVNLNYGSCGGVTALSNGNYVVGSPYWDNGVVLNVGAATWGNGTTGITGTVSITNSLMGGTADDTVGDNRFVTALSNGNYVVSSPWWDNSVVTDAGAATWGNGTTGITGVVSTANSLVGSTAGDKISYGVVDQSFGVTVLSNGNYVVSSPYWDNGVVTDTGAVTWGNGTTGITGVVSITNSLKGNTAYDQIGRGITALINGNYVVSGPFWDNGVTTDVGAATWGNGTTGITGVVSTTNSLVGSTMNDWIGNDVTALSNGNYVVSSPDWTNGAAASAGAVTWGNGTTGVTGVVSITNSLVGSATNDWIGNNITALSNGNYVVNSPYWDNGAVTDAGAATWGNGTTGTTGIVSTANSLVGSTASDKISYDVTALSNGNYVVSSPWWDNGAVTDAGAATWGNGTTGTTGVVTITNSLVGSIANDFVGYGVYGFRGVTALSNGLYVVFSPKWSNGAATNAGAVTLGDGRTGSVGPITADNSVRGSAAGGGSSMNFGYDYTHNQLVVGRPVDNVVTLFRALPSLSVSQSVTPNTHVPYHGIVTYTVILSNTGPLMDTNVLLTDTLPAGVTFGQWVEAPGDVIRNGNAITWTGTLTHSTAITLTFMALHTGNYGDVITNIAHFSGTSQTGSAAAEFSVVPLMYTVTVNTLGTGSGFITSTPAGINCGATCSAMFTADSSVTLTATPLISSTFTDWIGDVVTTTNPIALKVDADKAVTATFALRTFVITPIAGTNGSITPNTPQTMNYGANQTFTITANTGYHIADVGVDGGSVGAVSTYTFNNITANHTITAAFAINAFTLTVNYAGTGSGNVLLNPSSPTYPSGTVVTLTAVPSSTSIFAGWSGAVVTTTNPLALIMDETKSMTATFTSYRVYLPVVRK
jgi:hypothetical protein